jgi:UDPglucose 6-dehydrogenase
MRIGVIGAGYVGICTGVGFCQLGHEVTLADIDAARIDIINSGKPPIFEAGLDALIASLVGNKKLKATCDIDETVRKNDVIFICVGTPSDNEGRINLDFVKTVSSQIGKALSGHQGYPVIVVKSSVLPGTTESVIIPLLEKSSHLKMGTDFGAVMNPEFLAEGRALHDFLNPDRIVIGTPDEKSHEILSSLYRDFSSPALKVNFRTAEMIKYASNAALAARISFINEIGNICKLLDIDTYQVSRGVGLDPRIGPSFLNAGIGFGGSCLPKDVRALAAQADDLGYEAGLLKSVLKVNQDQPAKFVDFVESKIGSLENRKVAVLGLAFKSGTDDLRDSPCAENSPEIDRQKSDYQSL